MNKVLKMSKSRTWTFTEFDLGKLGFFRKCVEDNLCRAIAFGQEICPDTKREHIQGFVQFERAMTIGAVKKVLSSTAHLEKMKGSIKDNEVYCSKEGRYEKYGLFKVPGQRTDLDNFVEDLKVNPLTEVAINHPTTFVKYHSGLSKLNNILKKPKPRPKPEIIILIGSPGIGKSRWAYENYPDAYIATDNVNGWLDGYDGHETIIFDEFEGQWPKNALLRILDYHPYSGPVKGGFVTMFAHRFVFTMNIDHLGPYGSAMERRIHEFGRSIVLPPPPCTLNLESKSSDQLVSPPEFSETVIKLDPCRTHVDIVAPDLDEDTVVDITEVE